jgi:flagellar biosynthetic protein FliR
MTEVIAAARAALAPLQGEAWAAYLVFLRVGAVMAVLPGFGEHMVPLRLRLALAVAFTAVVAPAAPAAAPPSAGLAAMAGEVAAGLILGLGLRLMVMALQLAGSIAAQAASLAHLFGGAAPEPQPAVANLLVLGGLALAVAGGLHVTAAKLLILSYDVLPAGGLPDAGDAARLGVAQTGRIFALGFSLAAPFVIAAFVYNVALGIINRALPQLMVTFVGAPALSLGMLALLAVAAPVLLAVWDAAFDRHLADPLGLPR